MVTIKELEDAAFWDQWFCPDCGEVSDEEICENCGKEALPAGTIITILSHIREDGPAD